MQIILLSIPSLHRLFLLNQLWNALLLSLRHPLSGTLNSACFLHIFHSFRHFVVYLLSNLQLIFCISLVMDDHFLDCISGHGTWIWVFLHKWQMIRYIIPLLLDLQYASWYYYVNLFVTYFYSPARRRSRLAGLS